MSEMKTNKPGQIVELDMDRIPQHIGIIMDGNGRWAKARKLPRSMGHKAGVETIRNIVKESNRLGVKYLTLYAFSTENWKRPQTEVRFLMDLLVRYLKSEFKELNENNVIIDFIGDIEELPKVCYDELVSAYERTKHNTGVHMYLALNYGGQREIVRAFKKAHQAIEAGTLNIDDLDEKEFSRYLYAGDIPEPDLIIRPSGEYRLSNFMLYQSAYAEFWFSDIFWPDFKPEDLRQAIIDIQQRDRRFGGVKTDG